MRTFVITCAVLALWPKLAAAYPYYVAKGYTNCVTCHYSPSGGGLVNSYGAATVEATFPGEVEIESIYALQEFLAKRVVTGRDEQGTGSEFHWDIGIDSRVALLTGVTSPGAGTSLLFTPMLAELGGVLAWGPLLLYGTLSSRVAGDDLDTIEVFSREHWLAYQVSETTMIRAGRMVRPFGTRVPDHTLVNREDLGFGKFNQTYGVEVDYSSESWLLAVNLFAGDLLLDAPQLQERGVSFSAVYNLPARAATGVSVLAANTELGGRLAGALHTRVRVLDGLYAMAEVAGEHRWLNQDTSRQNRVAGFLRAGYFVLPSLELYGEASARFVLNAFALTKLRYQAGAQWMALPWLEIIPAIVLEEMPKSGLRATGMFQVHLFY